MITADKKLWSLQVKKCDVDHFWPLEVNSVMTKEGSNYSMCKQIFVVVVCLTTVQKDAVVFLCWFSIINHPSQMMFWVVLKWLNAKAEELLPEEQAGFRPGWSTVEQTFNRWFITEKHLHQRDLFDNFIDSKKAFDIVWHAGLWQVLRGFNIEDDFGSMKSVCEPAH